MKHELAASSSRPSDFGSFWYTVGRELSDISPSVEEEWIPLRSTDYADLYGVRVQSIGAYSIFGYLSVPKKQGPHPAIYYAPKNGSVLEIIPQGTANQIRERYMILSIASRGMRNSDTPYVATYPGQLIDGVDNPLIYIYRSVIADALRGLDYLVQREDVDTSRILVYGNDIALLVGALHGAVTHLVTRPAYFFDSIPNAIRTSTYPLEEFNDFLQCYPGKAENVTNALEYFNLRWHASAVTAETLIMAEPAGSAYSLEILRDLESEMSADVTMYESRNSTYKDGMYVERWITDRLVGADSAAILPNCWN